MVETMEYSTDGPEELKHMSRWIFRLQSERPDDNDQMAMSFAQLPLMAPVGTCEAIRGSSIIFLW